MTNLKPTDKVEAEYQGRDAVTIIEGELRQFNVGKFDVVKRYVEQIITGEFLQVNKEIDLTAMQEAPKQVPVNNFESERALIEAQMRWINRVNAWFNLFLGILAGMSVIHLVLLLSFGDKQTFLKVYGPLALTLNVIFLVFGNLVVIFGLTIAQIYKQKSEEKIRMRDQSRSEMRRHYTMSLALYLVCMINWALLFVLPHFVIQVHYM